MLANSLLPITFWAEAVSTACYVQNRVLVTKPHNKTPYELLPWQKFDGKADEGFFVGYFINSKAFRGVDQNWLFDIDLTNKLYELRSRRALNFQRVQRMQLLICCIVSPSVSTAGQSFTNADDLPTDPFMPDLEDTANLLNTGIFSGAYDDEDVGAEADLNNLETIMNVSPIPTTRIHKDHPKDQIIGDINSATQTRRMSKISEELAMMDVKSAFLYGTIEKEVYVCQPPGCEDPQFPDKVYKVEKALYGLHQAPKAWPDIMFAVCACARDSPFDLEAFSDSDYAGASLDRKSTTGGCQFLGKRLISWQCKKQTIVANSTTEAEYVAATNYRGQETDIQEKEQKESQKQTNPSTEWKGQSQKSANCIKAMLAIPHHSQVLSMAEIDSKEAQKKLKAGICFRIASHDKHTWFLLSQKKHKLQVQEKKTSAINRVFCNLSKGVSF
ncbi:retrovirus-related pol polyprotein from transposon TNT 1-94 [Tanacetum coccineum]